MNPKEHNFPEQYGLRFVVEKKVQAVLRGRNHSLSDSEIYGDILFAVTHAKRLARNEAGRNLDIRRRTFFSLLAREPVLVPELMQAMRVALDSESKQARATRWLMTEGGIRFVLENQHLSDAEMAAEVGGGVTGEDVKTARKALIKREQR